LNCCDSDWTGTLWTTLTWHHEADSHLRNTSTSCRNNDGDVDIYELANFTDQLSVLDSYQQLVEQHRQRRQQQQQQQQTQRVKRPAPRGSSSDYSTHKPTTETDSSLLAPTRSLLGTGDELQERRASEKEPVNKKPRTEDLDKRCSSCLPFYGFSLNSSVVHHLIPVVDRLMGPPLASLAKAKFALAPDSHHVVMDEDDSEECMFAYKLLLFARDEIFQMKGCQGTAHLRVLCRLPDNL
jgi:hypothetical protein